MTEGQSSAEQEVQQAIRALQSGDYPAAASILRTLAQTLPQEAMPWELLSKAEEALGDIDAAISALDKRLELEARNVGALLLRGALLEKRGDERGAASFYSTAIAQHAVDGSCPPPLMPLLQHAERSRSHTSNRFTEHLLDNVGGSKSNRVNHAIELLTGKREVYLQQPSMFYFPELPQRQFYEADEFPWLERMLERMPEMQAELSNVEQAGDSHFEPYVARDANRPAPNNPLLDDPSWGALWFWRNGSLVEENARACPATIAALEHAPMPIIKDRSPVALWSRLKPGTHIQPHHGVLNTRLICHIPIKTAPRCSLRVGNEVREWKDGQALVFDDSIEHEARNEGRETRTVLLFEIWRPELDEQERAELTKIFESIDVYSA